MLERVKDFFKPDKGFDVQSGTINGHIIGLVGVIVCLVSCYLPFVNFYDIIGYYYEFDSCITLILMIISAILIFYDKYRYTLIIAVTAIISVFGAWSNMERGVQELFIKALGSRVAFDRLDVKPEYGATLFVLGFALIFIDIFLHVKTKKEN